MTKNGGRESSASSNSEGVTRAELEARKSLHA